MDYTIDYLDNIDYTQIPRYNIYWTWLNLIELTSSILYIEYPAIEAYWSTANAPLYWTAGGTREKGLNYERLWKPFDYNLSSPPSPEYSTIENARIAREFSIRCWGLGGIFRYL